MPPIDGCLSWRSQGFTFSRRELLQKAVSAALLLPVPRPQLFTSTEAPKPEFWFGDRVSFCWNDENTEQPYSETGEVIGVTFDPRENQWEYAVIWLSSTAYPADSYPIYDGNFVTAGEICKL